MMEEQQLNLVSMIMHHLHHMLLLLHPFQALCWTMSMVHITFLSIQMYANHSWHIPSCASREPWCASSQ